MELVVIAIVYFFSCVAAFVDVGPEGRITKGKVAAPKQFPYQAGLRLYTSSGASWCGGSLISHRWVLTAGHCTDNLTTGVEVYLGAWDISDASENHQDIIFVSARNVIVHEAWNAETISNDISLIKLPFPIDFNEYIQPVALPIKAGQHDDYVGEQAIATGWGLTSDKEEAITDKLRWIEVPVMPNSGCLRYYPDSIKESNICVRTIGGISTCNGDSGGPLVHKNDNNTTLIGITSFGYRYGCGCEVGWPGIFTRITSYLDWIEEHSGVVSN